MPQILDLREANSYVDAVYWVRTHVVLKNMVTGPVLELEVLVKDGKVTLFMDPVDHYIMAFRGADKVYVLKDVKSAEFEGSLRKTFPGATTEVLHGLSVSHGPSGLGTFQNGRDFELRELREVLRLAEYSSKAKRTYEALKRPLSLLVFMIAESARMPMLERDFKNMYFGHSVFVDDAVQSYAKAKYLMKMAARCFPEYRDKLALAVEKLQKRAVELQELLDQIENAAKSSERHVLISNVLAKRSFAGNQSVSSQTSRFRDMCKELGLTKADEVTELISTMRDSSAVRAAEDGVVLPNLGG